MTPRDLGRNGRVYSRPNALRPSEGEGKLLSRPNLEVFADRNHQLFPPAATARQHSARSIGWCVQGASERWYFLVSNARELMISPTIVSPTSPPPPKKFFNPTHVTQNKSYQYVRCDRVLLHSYIKQATSYFLSVSSNLHSEDDNRKNESFVFKTHSHSCLKDTVSATISMKP